MGSEERARKLPFKLTKRPSLLGANWKIKFAIFVGLGAAHDGQFMPPGQFSQQGKIAWCLGKPTSVDDNACQFVQTPLRWALKSGSVNN